MNKRERCRAIVHNDADDIWHKRLRMDTSILQKLPHGGHTRLRFAPYHHWLAKRLMDFGMPKVDSLFGLGQAPLADR